MENNKLSVEDIKEITLAVLATLTNVYFETIFSKDSKGYLGLSDFSKGKLGQVEIVYGKFQQYADTKGREYAVKVLVKTVCHEWRHMQQYYWLYKKGGKDLVLKFDQFIADQHFYYIYNPLEFDAFEFQVGREIDNVDNVMSSIYEAVERVL